MKDLGTLGGAFGCASALNESGDVAGTSDLAGDQTFHPFLWRHGRLIDLGTLGGDYGSGNWLNNAGQVTGWAFTKGNNAFHAFLWSSGVMTDLGTVDGDQCSNANGMNARGDVVGASSDCGNAARAFLWHNGTMIDLNDYVPPSSNLHLFEGLYINDNGAIAGHGVLPDGSIHAFVLLPSDRSTVAPRVHVSYRLAVTARRPTLREMLTLLLAREARMKHMPFLNRAMHP
jgi:probable HAF family extracellular repeat protein